MMMRRGPAAAASQRGPLTARSMRCGRKSPSTTARKRLLASRAGAGNRSGEDRVKPCGERIVDQRGAGRPYNALPQLRPHSLFQSEARLRRERLCDAARCVLPIFIGPHTSLVSSTGPNFVDAPYVYVFAAFNMHVLRAYSSFCASALLCSQLSSCGLHVHDSICVCTFLLPLTMGAMALIPLSTRRPGSSRSPPVLRRLTFQSPRCISARGPLGHFRPRWLLMPGHMETPTQSLPSCNATLPQEI